MSKNKTEQQQLTVGIIYYDSRYYYQTSFFSFVLNTASDIFEYFHNEQIILL